MKIYKQGINEMYKSILFFFINDIKLPATPTATKHTKEKIKGLKHNRIVYSFVECLARVNELLWDIEDDKREHESKQDFGKEFIELARLVYILNDHRAYLKKQINKYSGSEIVEEKQHSKY